MADGKDRARIMRQFDDDLYAPLHADRLDDALTREFSRTLPS
ncbi:hypothetical protein [Actinoplanes rectilineatus]|nr:hypothetical protein [Actinoplanes rectilineatus]